MKQVTKVSIAGIGFAFDNDAYTELKQYLDNLDKIYKSNTDGEEVIADIEARIVELILSKQSIEQVVSIETIRNIVEQLGMPSEENDLQSDSEYTDINTASFNDEQFPRRFYRDKENSKLGGVCSGLGKYFDTDPVIFRIGIFIPLFMLILMPTLRVFFFQGFFGALFGALVLLYFILWISVPAAKTPRQKLEMRGRKITASEIERIVVSETTGTYPQKEKSASVFSKILIIIGSLILFFIKLFAIVIGFLLAIIAIVVIVGAIAFATGRHISFIASNGMTERMQELFTNIDGISPAAFSLMIAGVILIPIGILIYLIVKILFNTKGNSTVLWILGGAWIMLSVYTLVITLDSVSKITESISPNYQMTLPPSEERNIEDIRVLAINGDTIINNGATISMDELNEKYPGSVFPFNISQDEGGVILTINEDTLINKGRVASMSELGDILRADERIESSVVFFKDEIIDYKKQ